MEKNAPLTGLVTSPREPAAGRKPTLRTGKLVSFVKDQEFLDSRPLPVPLSAPIVP